MTSVSRGGRKEGTRSHRKIVPPRRRRRPAHTGVAVIGMACRFPGANNYREFWDNLAAGRDSVAEVPQTRWDVDEFYDPNPLVPNKTYSKWGGFLSDIDEFDASFFDISPAEAELMDPQQRLFLQEAWKALEDAAYSDRDLDNAKCGVFIGFTGSDFRIQLREARIPTEVHDPLGSLGSVLAARISHFLNLKGPSVALDASCSSSLVAVHSACESILTGTMELAIAGGADMRLAIPDLHIMMSKRGVLSPDGKCKAFDNGADGFVPGEGIGVVVLKELEAALRDGDHIYAVIKGSGVNHDGKTKGITVPSGASQTALECEVYDKYNINPETIGFVEAHGTGTKKGDPIEVAALTEAFRKHTSKKQYCAIGSVKTNIGHLIGAAGIAGLVKVLLCLKHKSLAPSLHLHEHNELIDFQNSPFYVNTKLEEWRTRRGQPRRAAISSFGFSGTNCHMVVEEAPASKTERSDRIRPYHIVPLSAKTDDALDRRIDDLAEWLEAEGTQHPIEDIVYTLYKGRSLFSIRSALVVRDINELRHELAEIRHSSTAKDYLVGAPNEVLSGLRPAFKALGEHLIQELAEPDLVTDHEYKEKLLVLADLYVKGCELDWERLCEEGSCQRIPMPTYPFATERHGIPVSDEVLYSDVRGLHPLIDKVLPRMVDHGLVFQKTLRRGHPILRDHKVASQAVLPSAAHLEMAWAAVSQIANHQNFVLSEVEWLHPVEVQDSQEDVQIAIRQANEQVQYEIQTGSGGSLTTNARGKVRFAAPDLHRVDERVSIGEIKSRCTSHIDKEMLHAIFKGAGVDYDSYFQGLSEVWTNGREALGILRVHSEYEKELKHYTLHPTLMQGALQTMAALAGNSSNIQRLLPSSAEEVEVLHPLRSQGYAYVRVAGNNRFHVAILDETGLVCVKAHSLAITDMKESSVSDSKDPVERLIYAPRWVSAPLPPTPPTDLAKARKGKRTDKRTVLVISSQESSWLAEALTEAHAADETIEIRLGYETRDRSEGIWEVKTEDPIALDNCIRRLQSLDSIYFLGGIESHGTDLDDLDVLEQRQERGVISLFRLVKSLATHGFTRNPVRLRLVTNGVYQIVPGEIIRPCSASLHGLAKSVAKEYPHLEISHIDVSLEETRQNSSKQKRRALAKAILAEPRHKQGEEIAVRGGKRYVRILQPLVLPLGGGRTPFRHEGVYLILGGAGGIGLELSRYLSETVQARLILIGRSELDLDQRGKLSEIEAKGGKVLYLQADATDFESLNAAVDKARAEFGKINGVIHSAVAGAGKSLQNMDEETFRAALEPKVRGSVILHSVMRGESLDFMMFFSSIQSFLGSVRQGSYAAGCAFEDAFALRLGQEESYLVKTINWGYWASGIGSSKDFKRALALLGVDTLEESQERLMALGIQSTEDLEKRLAILGFQPITSDEGVEALERILAHGAHQSVVVKADDDVLEQMGIGFASQTELYPERIPSLVQTVGPQLIQLRADRHSIPKLQTALSEFEAFARHLLLDAFQRMGAFRHADEHHNRNRLRERLKIAPGYHRLYEALLDILSREGFVQIKGDDMVTTQKISGEYSPKEPEYLEQKAKELAAIFPEIRGHIRLLSACLGRYPDILRGDIPATDVLFPHSSMELVEGIYKGNAIVDYFNELVAQSLRSYVQSRIPLLREDEIINIIEVGAGTGATSVSVLEAIREYGERLNYVYTDISVAFTQYGQQQYEGGHPFMQFGVLNIEKDVREQGYEAGDFDVVIGANVLHATRRLRDTLRNLKALLKTNGWLVLNEVTQVQDFATHTFGLLDGWWLFEDEQNRLKGSPLLSSDMWERILKEEGFERVVTLGQPASGENELPQRVLIAESDGRLEVGGRDRISFGRGSSPSPRTEDLRTDQPSDSSRQLGLSVPVQTTVTPELDLWRQSTPQPTGTGGRNASQLIENSVTESLASVLQQESQAFNPDVPFADFGVDSILAVEIINRVNERLGIRLRTTDLFNYSTIRDLTRHIADEFGTLIDCRRLADEGARSLHTDLRDLEVGALTFSSQIEFHSGQNERDSSRQLRMNEARSVSSSQDPGSDIAVIGMSGQFADAKDVTEYWANLAAGKNSISEIPDARWDWDERLYGPQSEVPRMTYARWGGFLTDIDVFDPLFFNISPMEAELMDPRHRLLLQEAWKALEDAGYSDQDLKGKKCGVFVGCQEGDYTSVLRGDTSAYVSTGNSNSTLPARISYFLDLKGPSLAVDTACSSSLVAIHLACESIRNGSSDLAIAGGVALMTTPLTLVALGETGMLSPEGKCKTFDSAADGFVLGEGVGVVILKSLEAARKSGDHIYGVIKGSEINQDGRTSGITAPSTPSQMALECEVYRKYGINPETITYVEAHGTGTKLGDPIEIHALTDAFQKHTHKKQYCAIGSVKTNVGHTMAAAGIAGFIKLLLCLQHGKLVPSLNFRNENEHIDFGESPFYVNTELKDWTTDRAEPRRAAISAFGLSGTNCHIVVDESRQGIETGIDRPRKPHYLIALSAKTEASLNRKIGDLASWLDREGAKHPIGDIAYTLHLGRSHFSVRSALVVEDVDELRQKIMAIYERGDADSYLMNNLGDTQPKLEPALVTFGERLVEEVQGLATSAPAEYRKKLLSLADLYVKGHQLDWRDLYRGESCCRISMPTYPFERERYWLPASRKETTKTITDWQRSTTTLEPLTESTKLSLLAAISDAPKTIHYHTVWEKSKPGNTALEACSSRELAKDPPGPVLLFDTNEEVRSVLRERLNTEEEGSPRIVLVKPGESYREVGFLTYEVNPEVHEDYHRLARALKDADLIPRLVLFLPSFVQTADTEGFRLHPKTPLSTSIYSVYYLIKAFSEMRTRPPTRFLFIVGGAAEAPNPYVEAASGYSRSLQFIYPNLSFSTVQVPALANGGNGVMDVIMRELSIEARDTAAEIRYHDGQRYVKKVKPLEVMHNEGPRLRKEGVYLITGGAGGLGLLLTRYLTERYRAKVVLVGRSQLEGEKQKRIDELQRAGAEVLYLKADVAEQSAIQGVLGTIKQKYGGLNGVIHAAGIINESLITQKDVAQFEATLRPKVQGTIVLDEVTKGEALDFLVMFSSASSILGDFGQCDYAIGNRFMDGYAQLREAARSRGERQGQTIAIDWPLWREGRMHGSKESEFLYLQSSGLTYLETESGLRAFEEILASACTQVMVLTGDQTRIDGFLNVGEEAKEARTEDGGAAIREFRVSNIEGMPLGQRIELDIRQMASELLKIPAHRLDTKENLGNFGFDSINLKRFANRLSQMYGVEISPTVFFAHPTLRGISEHLLADSGEELAAYYTKTVIEPQVPLEQEEVCRGDAAGPVEPWCEGVEGGSVHDRAEEPIAIIGASGAFPGSRDLREYWQNLEAEKDLITEIPADRWDWRDYCGDSAGDQNPANSKWGGFIADVDKFDPSFFSISPREAEAMDPQHRLFLETTWKAIEDAGYPPSDLSGRRVGVFVGLELNDYQQLLQRQAELRAQMATGNADAMVANRVSYLLDLRGPSEAIDTACSSSLIAVHRAVKSIQSGESELAIAGGVSLILSPHNMVGTGQMGVLSPDGRCKTFDKDADGYVKGEGVGSLLLKPLNRAVEDRDHIYAVIKGTAENHGGKAASLTAPNSEAQAALLVEAYEEAGMDPETVTYVETHGTGTELGDPVEIDGLKKAFDELARRRGEVIGRRHYCGLGSVKTNVGHLEPAAGMAGIMKVILAMQHKKLPGTLHLRELNPYIDLEETPFYVVERTQPWKRIEDDHGDPIPLRAGVSSFGFGGSNAHVVLEEYESPMPTAGQDSQYPQIIVLSARNRYRLRDYAHRMANFLRETTAEGNLRQADGESLELAIQERLIRWASDILRVGEQDIEPEEDIWELGFDQITLAKFRDRLNENYKFDMTQDLFSELRSIGSLARYLCHEHGGHLAQHQSEGAGQMPEEKHDQRSFSLADIAYTLHMGRDAMDERLAVIASSIDELTAKLAQYDQGRTDIEGLYTGSATSDQGHVERIVEGSTGEEFIKAVIDDRDLAKLALLWVSGVDIDWRLLYASQIPRRIPLPTYPFARERYWLSASDEGRYGEARSLHPLVDRVDPKLSLGHGIAFQKVFRNTDLILRDHKVDGAPVLPATAHLEMALAAVSQIKDDFCPSICRAFWLSPLTVPDDSREVRIVVNDDNGKLHYEIQTGTHAQTITHSKGEFRLNAAPSAGTDQRISVEETKARCSHHIDRETLYASFKDAGIAYGSYFQGLNEVWGSDEEALGHVSLPPEHEHQLTQYALHPSLIDAALQTAAGLSGMRGPTGTRPRLPFAVERVEILHPLKARGYAYVRADGRYRFNVAILDETGVVCVKLHNVAVRELKDPLQGLFYAPRWVSSPLSRVPREREAAGEEQETDRRTVLIASGPHSLGLENHLAEAHAGDQVFVVKLGSETKQDSDRKWEIRAEDPTSLDAFVGSLECIHTIYFLGGLESRALDIDDLDSLEESQECGVLSLLRLVKSLSKHGFRQKSIELKVVTNDVHRVVPEEMTRPYQASLHGLTSSVAKEYPQWHISCVDISLVGAKKTLAKQKARELVEAIRAETRLKPGEAVAIREGKRYVRTLRPIQLPPVTETPFRHNGVYLILGGAGGIGLELSQYLAETVQAGLVLIGRSEPNDDQKQKISLIESRGGKVLYLQADATDLQSMETAVRRAKSHFGRIDGVVHSALVLRDKTLENMDEESFRAALGPKVKGSVILHKVMRDEPLDFMMFFSSAQSFSGNAGQGNYAAGSTFEDAFALYLGRQESYPVKVVNWGYWGSVGIVASEEYNKRLASMGVQSIRSEEGMEAIQRILAHNVDQIIPLRARDDVLEHMGADLQHEIELYPETGPSLIMTVAHQVEAWRAATAASQGVDHMEAFQQLERLGQCLLMEAFQKMGVFKRGGEQYGRLQLRERLGIVPHYHRLYEALLDILIRGGFIEANGQDVTISQALEKGKFRSELESLDDKGNHLIASFPSIEPYLNLLWICLKAYPELLTGQRSYVEVMFPKGSMDLVENIYKGNKVTDYYNNLVAQIVKTFVQLKAQEATKERIRILEVGAGTGATSASVLQQIEDYADRLHYCYTDISIGFTQHGEREFGEERPFMEFKVLDIERQPEKQGFEPNSYDLILASNVIHATKRIGNTLNRVKRLLRNKGLLIVNEATQRQDFVTLTFGLTDGWWLFEDEENRLKESPLLGPEDWAKVLQTNGFQHVQVFGMPSTPAETSQQNVIIAESDGAVLVDRTQQAAGDHERELVAPPIPQDSQRPRRIRGDLEPSPLTPEPQPTRGLMEGTLDYVKEVFAEVLKTSKTQIESQATFEKFGVDSLLAMEIIHRLERDFGDLPATLLFEYMTAEKLSEYFVLHHQERLATVIQPQTEISDADEIFARVPTSEPVGEERQHHGIDDIAIVGVSGRYPLAETLDDYWENLKSGRNCVTEVPKERWDWRDHYDPSATKEGISYSKWGAFIGDADRFDPLFFNILPVEAESMDPQERLFLETAWAVLEDAGYTRKDLSGTGHKVGVFVGVMNSGYEFLAGQASSGGQSTGAHSAHWSIANRVSYCFDFQGPSIAIDTACSSSLTAIHLACESIRIGECQSAIAGGVNLILHPGQYERLSSVRMLASDDKCRSFGEGADGFVDGEGVGAVLLKPLLEAIRDRDHVYAVVKGSSINSGGKTSGYTVPNPNAQVTVILEALEKAKVDPQTISYVEAHGTGTSLGDPIEVVALAKAFQRYTEDRQFCSIGSVKSNIGHLESASGIAGLTKVLLQMKHKQLVPSIHSEVLNPNINFEDSPFYVQQHLTDWKQRTVSRDGEEKTWPRRVGLSSFGAGGANAHIVLEEYEDPVSRPASEDQHPQVILLSARNENRLKAYAQRMATFLHRQKQDEGDSERGARLADIAYTLGVGREAMDERLAVIVSSTMELRRKLDEYCEGRLDIEHLYQGNANGHRLEHHTTMTGDLGELPDSIRREDGKLADMAQLWVSGGEVDWRLIGPTQNRKRIPLPTYPFARERYWIRESDGRTHTAASASHPLVGGVDPRLSLDQGIVFRKVLRKTDLIVSDHRVAGQPVLPAAAQLEMAHAAASQVKDGRSFSIYRTVWLYPLVVGVSKQVRVVMKQENERLRYEVQSGSGNDTITHSQGELRQDATSAGKNAQRISIEEIKARCGHHMDKQTLYENFGAMGITYGSYFQGLNQVWGNEEEALGYLSLPPGYEKELEYFTLHPSLVDAALQTMVGLMGVGLDGKSTRHMLPFAVGQVESLHALKARGYAYIRAVTKDRFNVAITDETGLVCIELHDVSVREAKDTLLWQSVVTDSRPFQAVIDADGDGEMGPTAQEQGSTLKESQAEHGRTERPSDWNSLGYPRSAKEAWILGSTARRHEVPQETTANRQGVERTIEAEVVETIAAALEADQREFDLDSPFADFGVDSILAVRIVNAINDKMGTELGPTDLFNYSTIRRLAHHISLELGAAVGHQHGTDADASGLLHAVPHHELAWEVPSRARDADSQAMTDSQMMDLLRRVEIGEVHIDEAKQLIERACDG